MSLQDNMDRTLALLQNADPANPAPDPQELIQLEGTRRDEDPLRCSCRFWS